MNFHLKIIKLLLMIVLLLEATVKEANAIKPLKDFLKMIKDQLFEKQPTKNNAFDDSVVYAVPSPDGHGFILSGYGKPHDPYKYDNNVDIYQKHKMWSGNVKLPNMFGNDDYSSKNDRVVKGFDNRLGFRIAIPFLGDFQYLREIGPGRFTDNLGPGDFPYPGFKDKKSYSNAHHVPYGYGQGTYGPYGDLYGTNGLPYGHPNDGPVSEHVGNYYAQESHPSHPGHPDHHYSGSEVEEVFSEVENHAPEEEKKDVFEGMRNYPWYRRR